MKETISRFQLNSKVKALNIMDNDLQLTQRQRGRSRDGA